MNKVIKRKKRIPFKKLSASQKLKRILKIITGIIIFFTLPSFLFFGFLYLKYNEDLPEGNQGDAADVLAHQMLNVLDYGAYEATDYIEWTFKGRHHYKWHKSENRCEVYWGDFKVELDLNNNEYSKVYVLDQEYNGIEKQDYINKAELYFNNDSFWLVAPYKVFDKGVERRLVKTEDNKDALLVTYTSGGSTPGDSYLWHLDADGKPTRFQMWASILPINGLSASWDDWATTKSGAQLPTFHKLLVLGLEIDDIVGSTQSQLSVITCKEESIGNENSEFDPKLIKSCVYKDFKSVSTGNPNYQGKYYWTYEFFQNDKKIMNSLFFNENVKELESLINKNIRAEYEKNLNSPELKNCMNLIKLKYYSINEIGISFSESEFINFHINYNINTACSNVGGSTQMFKISELSKYTN